MSAVVTLSNSVLRDLNNGTIDLDSATVKVALLANTFTADAAFDIFADVSAHEIAASGGYTTGGTTLTGKVVSYVGTSGKFEADPATWLALTHTFRHAAMYIDATVNGVVKPLIMTILLDGADITVAGVDYVLQWHPSGIIVFNKV